METSRLTHRKRLQLVTVTNTDAHSEAASPGTEAASSESCCGGATRWITHDDAVARAARLGAIADPIRLQVVSVIANAPDGEVCACDFVGPLGKSQPTISHHLKVLAEAGIIEGDKRGRWIWYHLAPGGLDGVADQLRAVATGEV